MEVPGLRAALSLNADEWINGLNRAQSALSSWESAARGTFDRFSNSVTQTFQTAGKVMVGFGATIAGSMGGALVVFSEFDRAAREVTSILDKAGRESNNLRTEVRNLTNTMGLNVSAAEAMRGAYTVVSAGFTDATERQDVLRAGLQLSRAGLADTQSTLLALTGALNAYGKGSESASDFSDVLFKTIQLGQTTLPELAQVLSRATTSAAQAGVSFEELGSAIAVMTVKGMPTATAMDSINRALVQIQAPSTDAKKALAEVGLQADTLQKTLRSEGLGAALAQVFKAAQGDVATLRRILGEDLAVKAAQTLGAGGGAEMAAARTQMADRSGAAAAGAQETAKALGEQLGITKNLLMDLALSVGEALMPAITMINKGLRSVIEVFTSMPEAVKQSIAQFAALGSVMMIVGGAILTLAPGILQLTVMLGLAGLAARIPVVVAGFQLLAGQVPLAAMAITGLSSRLPLLFTGLTSLARMAIPAVLQGIAALFSGLGSLLPIVAIVGASVFAMVEAWRTNFGGLRDLISDAMENIVVVLRVGVLAAKAVWTLTWSAISTVVKDTLRVLDPVFRELGGLVRDVATLASVWIGTLITSMSPAQMQSAVYGLELLKFAVQAIWMTIRDVFTVAARTVATAISAIRVAVEIGGEAILTAWDSAMLIMIGKTEDAMERVADGFRNAKRVLLVALAGVIRSLMELIARAIDDAEILGFKYGEAIARGIRASLKSLPTINPQQTVLSSVKSGTGVMDLLKRLLPAEATEEVAKAIVKAKTPAGAPPAVTPETPATPPTPSAASRQMTRGEMIAFIKRNANVTGNIEGLTKEALVATFKLIENAMKEGIKLGITSGKRFGTGKSLHDIGMALDVTVPGQGLGSTKAGALVAELAKGTGFKSGINEYLQEALRVTGGTGPHVHLAMREDGKNIPGFFRVAGAASTAMERVNEALAKFGENLLRAGLQAASSGARARAEIQQRFGRLREEGIAAGASQAQLAEVERLRKESLARLAAEEEKSARETAAKLLEIRVSLSTNQEEVDRARILRERDNQIAMLNDMLRTHPEFHSEINRLIVDIHAAAQTKMSETAQQFRDAEEKARLDSMTREREARLADLDFQTAMGRTTLEQRIAAIQQELAVFEGSEEQKRTLALQLLDLERQNLRAKFEEQGLFFQQSLEQEAEYLTAKTELTIAEEARLAAIREQMAAQVRAQRDQVQQYLQVIEDKFGEFLGKALSGQMSFAEAFRGLWKNLADFFIQEVARMIAKVVVLIAKLAIMRLLSGGGAPPVPVSTGIGPTGSFVPGLEMAHNGGIITAHGVRSFHQGGMVSRGVPSLGSTGLSLRSDEVLAKLQTGEMVLSRDQVAGLREGDGGKSVNVYVSPSMVQSVNPEQLGRVIGRDILWRLQGA